MHSNSSSVRERSALRAAAILALAAAVRGQVPSSLFVGAAAGDSFGVSVDSAGDVDGDGRDDVIVGGPGVDDGSLVDAGGAYVYSGATGALLRTHVGAASQEPFGYVVSGLGDVDADGRDDYGVGGPGVASPSSYGIVRVFSGASGAVIQVITGSAPSDGLGFVLERAGDVDHDGHADFWIGKAGSDIGGTDIGRIELISGANGSVLRSFDGGAPSEFFGGSIASGFDLDLDGYDDIVVGATGGASMGSNTGVVRALSGLNGGLLWSNAGPASNSFYGDIVRFVGDVNLDGKPEVAAASSHVEFVRILDGATGATILTLTNAEPYQWFARSVARVGDANGDGRADVAIGIAGDDTHGYNAGVVRIVSCVDGSTISTLFGPTSQPGDVFGWRMAFGGDMNGDGASDLLVSTPYTNVNGTDSGLAQAFLGGCPPPQVYCVAKTNSLGCVPSLSWSGMQSLSSGGDLVVRAASVLSNAPGILFFGSQRAAVPFGGGTLCATGSPIVRTPVQGSGGASGPVSCTGQYEFHFTAAYMASKGLVPGARVCAQFYSRDNGFAPPNNIGLSDAVEFLVCP